MEPICGPYTFPPLRRLHPLSLTFPNTITSHDGQGAIGKWIQTGIRRAKLLGLDLQPGADGAGGDVGNRPLQGLSEFEEANYRWVKHLTRFQVGGTVLEPLAPMVS